MLERKKIIICLIQFIITFPFLFLCIGISQSFSLNDYTEQVCAGHIGISQIFSPNYYTEQVCAGHIGIFQSFSQNDYTEQVCTCPVQVYA